MHTQLETMHETETQIIDVLDAPDLKHILGADIQTIALTFATFQVDDWRNHARLLFAVRR